MSIQLKNVIKLFPRKRGKLFYCIKNLTGLRPGEVSLYELALLHKSVQKKSPDGECINYERLEFLGDAILGAVIAHELYKLFPDEDEGALTQMRSRIVNRSLLNKVGLKLELDQLILIQSQVDISQTHILGDVVEAIIGAVFIDHGYYKTKQFILGRIIEPHFNIFEIALKDSNYKSKIIEWGQQEKQEVVFEIDESEDSASSVMSFSCRVIIEGVVKGEGIGTSKKEAQQNAARAAFKNRKLQQ